VEVEVEVDAYRQNSTQNKLCLNSFDTKAQHKGMNENSFQRYEQGLKAEDKKDDH
jgi:hypothetical protein